MKIKAIKSLSIIILSSLCTGQAFSYDWPVKKTETNQIISYFGQKKGDNFVTGLTIKDAEEVYASDEGNPLIVIEDSDDDTDFFPSALGTAIIIHHNDNLISVYSNLDRTSIKDEPYTKTLTKEEIIGKAGNSGYKDDLSAVGFQIIDLKEKKAINPQILLPSTAQVLPLSISGIHLKNKNGVLYDLQYAKNFNYGVYKVYFKRNELAVPFKTAVLVNGETEDEIIYSSLNQENGKTNVLGKVNYQLSDIYPDDRLMLAGSVNLRPGKATLSLIFTDIKESSRQLNYSITVH